MRPGTKRTTASKDSGEVFHKEHEVILRRSSGLSVMDQRILKISRVKWRSASLLERVCLHSSQKGLQTMLIRMPADYTYEYIKDNVKAEMSFHVIEGHLEIAILENGKQRTYNLEPGDTLYLDRRLFRKTATKEHACVYLENIGGGHKEDARIRLESMS